MAKTPYGVQEICVDCGRDLGGSCPARTRNELCGGQLHDVSNATMLGLFVRLGVERDLAEDELPEYVHGVKPREEVAKMLAPPLDRVFERRPFSKLLEKLRAPLERFADGRRERRVLAFDGAALFVLSRPLLARQEQVV
jgi:hypothetical protein